MATINPYETAPLATVLDAPRSVWRAGGICGYLAIALLLCVIGFLAFASTVQPMPANRIPAASVGVTLVQKSPAVLFITSEGDGGVTITREDGRKFSEDENLRSSEIIKYVTAELEGSAEPNKNYVMMFGDADVTARDASRVHRVICDAFEDIVAKFVVVKEE